MAAVGISAAHTLPYRHHSAVDRARAVAGQSAFTLLDRNYRCVPEIIAFCNEHLYGGQLKVERPAGDGEALAGDLPRYGFRMDDVAAGETGSRASNASKSALNTQEAQRVIGLVRQYVWAGVTDIGVVTPFRAQRALLEQLLHAVARTQADVAVRAAMEQVEIGTIHTFQGGQHQLMLFSTVVAQGARPGTVRWFEENRNLLNVAISRARDLLIVVGHRATLAQAGGILAAMVRYVDGLLGGLGRAPAPPPGPAAGAAGAAGE